jgi:hypothetical protein
MGEFDFVGGGRQRIQRNAPQQIHNVQQPLVDQNNTKVASLVTL